MTFRLYKISVSIIVSLWTTANLAQTVKANAGTAPLPQGILLPWHYAEPGSGWVEESQQALNQAHARLADAFFSQAESLDRYLSNNAQNSLLSKEQRKSLGEVRIGTLRSPSRETLVIEPALCSFADKFWIFITISDFTRQHFLGAENLLTPKEPWLKKSGRKSLKPLLAQITSELWTRSATLSASLVNVSNDDTLEISLRSRNSVTRVNQASHLCLNMIASQKLAQQGWKIQSTNDQEHLRILRQVFLPLSKLTRATRHLLIDWNGSPASTTTSDEMTFQTQLSMTEAVFAREAKTLGPMSWKLKNVENRVVLDWDNALVDTLKKEKSSLAKADLPRVVKVQQAWAYLDRGRAWGLTMNERMESGTTTNPIMGHVVGFFGPEQKLSNALGDPVYEGAILYIRKGQAQVRVGDTFTFDPTTFPKALPTK